MNLKIALLICSMTVFADAKNHKHEKRIKNGLPAGLGQFPYQILVERKKPIYFHQLCGGALIKPDFVLTAAHCIINEPMQVRAGFLTDTHLDGITIGVSSKNAHPDFNKDTLENDIAILQLKDSFPISETISTVGLPAAGSAPSGTGDIAGWSITNIFDVFVRRLYYGSYDVLSKDECKSILGTTLSQKLQDSEFCARSNTTSVCQIDFGGPLVVNNVTIGVTSWGMGCASVGEAVVLTTVSNYTDWINNTINGS